MIRRGPCVFLTTAARFITFPVLKVDSKATLSKCSDSATPSTRCSFKRFTHVCVSVLFQYGRLSLAGLSCAALCAHVDLAQRRGHYETSAGHRHGHERPPGVQVWILPGCNALTFAAPASTSPPLQIWILPGWNALTLTARTRCQPLALKVAPGLCLVIHLRQRK